MESYGLEMDDLFDDGDIAQDINEFETAPDNADQADPENDAANNTQHDEGDISQQVAEKLKQLGKGAAKKRVLRPQPKLDPIRLTGERGIPLLPKLFEDVKYKGKGHEISDLDKMMGVIEHWGHRLFPKMPFDELIERVERLGQKKAVQTCVSKMRLDMPVLEDEFVTQVSDDEAVAAAGDNNTQPEQDDFQIVDGPEAQHTILDEDEEALNDILEEERAHSQNVILSASTPYPKSKPGSQSNTSGLTAEQMERIRLNQERAKQKRLNVSNNASTTVNSIGVGGGEHMETSGDSDNDVLTIDEESTPSTNKNLTSHVLPISNADTEQQVVSDISQETTTAIIADNNEPTASTSEAAINDAAAAEHDNLMLSNTSMSADMSDDETQGMAATIDTNISNTSDRSKEDEIHTRPPDEDMDEDTNNLP